MKSDFRYEASIYNNFPWPEQPPPAFAGAASAATGTRVAPEGAPAGSNEHLAAEKAAGRKPPRLTTDAERVAFLFQRYQALTSLLPQVKAKQSRKRQRDTST